MRGEAIVASRGWGRADSTRAFRAGPTAAASARLPTWYAPPSSCAAFDNCTHQQKLVEATKFQGMPLTCLSCMTHQLLCAMMPVHYMLDRKDATLDCCVQQVWNQHCTN